MVLRSQIQAVVGMLSSLVARRWPVELKAIWEEPRDGWVSVVEVGAAGGVVGCVAMLYERTVFDVACSCQILVHVGFKRFL